MFYIIISIVALCVVYQKFKTSPTYSTLETISKEIKLKKSPSPRHSPVVVKKSNQRARVFSASNSKSRSRSKNRSHKNNLLNSCQGDLHANLNSTNTSICCSNGGVDNFSHNGVVLDLEDCCQMTLCDTVCYITAYIIWNLLRIFSESLIASMNSDFCNFAALRWSIFSEGNKSEESARQFTTKHFYSWRRVPNIKWWSKISSWRWRNIFVSHSIPNAKTKVVHKSDFYLLVII